MAKGENALRGKECAPATGTPAEGSGRTKVAPSAVTHKLFHGGGVAWARRGGVGGGKEGEGSCTGQ